MVGALGLIALGCAMGLGSGCSTYAERPAPVLARRDVEVIRVAPSLANAVAEGMAARHEGDFTLVGAGESMQPAYPPGTVLVVHPTSYFMLRSGMAVVYRSQHGRHVAHVLVGESIAGWTAQGLNNAAPDDEVVTSGNLVGIVRCALVPDTAVVALPPSVSHALVAKTDASAIWLH